MSATTDKIMVRVAVIAWRDSGGVVHYEARGWSTDISERTSHFISNDRELDDYARTCRDEYGDDGDSWGQPFIIEAEIDAPPPLASLVVKGVVK